MHSVPDHGQHIHFLILLRFSLIVLCAVKRDELPMANSNCKLPKDRGTKGEAAVAIKWFFDTETLQCLAFAFKENANCPVIPSLCSIVPLTTKSQSIYADYGGCSGQRPSANNSRGEPIVCSGTGTEKCPPGYKCQMLAFFGVCCHSETEEMFHRNFHPPKCANGKSPHNLYDSVNKVSMVYLGKNCTDEFCPIGRGMKCEQQEIFAHCCPK